MTTDHEASRTLVKSPPELWAECSDAGSLARHLDGTFGEIRITRLEPETVVAWEGERVSGTVRLEPSGWGTRVTLTARTEAQELTPQAVVEVPADVVEGLRQAAEELRPHPVEPGLHPVEPESPAAATPPGRARLWSRFFARFRPFATPVPAEPVITAAPEATPEPVVPVAPEPEPVAPVAEPAPVAEEPAEPVAEEPVGSEQATAPDAIAVLTAALDSLGQAHHRPFSRA